MGGKKMGREGREKVKCSRKIRPRVVEGRGFRVERGRMRGRPVRAPGLQGGRVGGNRRLGNLHDAGGTAFRSAALYIFPQG